MPKKTIDHSLPPGKPDSPEAIPSQNDTANATPSNGAAGAESQIPPAASDSTEATALSPITQDACGNRDLPDQATDANPSPAQPGTAEPTSPQDETSEVGATKDEAGAESQVSAAQSNTPEYNRLLIAKGRVSQPPELEDGGCFGPFIAQDPVSTAPKPALKPKPLPYTALLDSICRSHDSDPTPTGTTSETAFPAPAAAEGKSDTEMAQPSEILPAPVEAPLPPPRVATAVELFTWIKLVLLALTRLTEYSAEFVAFWANSTWINDALDVLPCLVITGPAYDARCVLHVLHDFCQKPALLAGFLLPSLHSALVLAHRSQAFEEGQIGRPYQPTSQGRHREGWLYCNPNPDSKPESPQRADRLRRMHCPLAPAEAS